MSNYPAGIYQDVDHDLIKVDADGNATVIGVGHNGTPFINLAFASKIADLPKSERTPEPAPRVLEDGVYREPIDGGDTVLVRDGKVTEILATGDGCPVTNGYHLEAAHDSEFLTDLVRLVAPETPEPPLPTDGFYVDGDGDVVQVKGDQMRYIDWGGSLGSWQALSNDYPTYGPYTALVEETTTK